MRFATRFTTLLCLLVFCLTTVSFAQLKGDPEALSAIASAKVDMGGRAPVNATKVPIASISSVTFDEDGNVVGSFGNASLNANTSSTSQTGNDDRFDIDCRRPNKSNIDGLITVATFDGAFVAQAGPDAGNDFRFTMLGNDPRLGCTTVYHANIDEVSLQLLNADGSVFKTVPFAPFEKATMESPNFEPLNYRSGHGIEYGDAVHRAQFFHVMGQEWHTLLIPKVVNKVTITVPRFVNVRLRNGNVIQARSYFTGTASDGSTFVLMLNLLFNFFFDNEVVNEINAANFTTNGINTTMWPNTFLFRLNVNNPNVPGGCCVLGFHTYFLDGGFPEHRWITQFASWISPGLFGAGFQDVVALSHETSEIFGNPFIDNVTPNWQFPGVPANAKVCQNILEEGDPIEGLANATTTIKVNEADFKFTYHPQNIPLLQWFEMGTTSSALDGAFSFPDETVLPHSALPCPQ